MAKAPLSKKAPRASASQVTRKSVASKVTTKSTTKPTSKSKDVKLEQAKKRSATKRFVATQKPIDEPREEKDTTKKDDASNVVKRKVGRPKGSGKYGEPIKSVRIPISLADLLESYIERKGFVVPIYDSLVQAGFPSPAEDVNCESLDLGAFLIPNPAATFFIRATGESMRDAGIYPNDILIVDRSLEPVNGDVVIAALDGEFTVKRLFKTGARVELRPENRKFRPICVTEEMDFTVWGVVKKVIHSL